MEDIFFSSFLFLLLFKSSKFGVVLSVLPVINNIITCNNDMSFVHSNKSRFNSDCLIFNWTTYSIAKNDNPLVLSILYFSNKDTVLSTSRNLLKSSHVLNMLFIDNSIPKDNAHIVSLWLSESKDKGVVEVSPHVLRLNIGEKYIAIYC